MLRTILVAAILFTTALMLRQSVKQTELNECSMWLEQQNQYTRWYAAKWQIQQCETYGVELEQVYLQGEPDQTVVIPK